MNSNGDAAPENRNTEVSTLVDDSKTDFQHHVEFLEEFMNGKSHTYANGNEQALSFQMKNQSNDIGSSSQERNGNGIHESQLHPNDDAQDIISSFFYDGPNTPTNSNVLEKAKESNKQNLKLQQSMNEQKMQLLEYENQLYQKTRDYLEVAEEKNEMAAKFENTEREKNVLKEEMSRIQAELYQLKQLKLKNDDEDSKFNVLKKEISKKTVFEQKLKTDMTKCMTKLKQKKEKLKKSEQNNKKLWKLTVQLASEMAKQGLLEEPQLDKLKQGIGDATTDEGDLYSMVMKKARDSSVNVLKEDPSSPQIHSSPTIVKPTPELRKNTDIFQNFVRPSTSVEFSAPTKSSSNFTKPAKHCNYFVKNAIDAAEDASLSDDCPDFTANEVLLMCNQMKIPDDRVSPLQPLPKTPPPKNLLKGIKPAVLQKEESSEFLKPDPVQSSPVKKLHFVKQATDCHISKDADNVEMKTYSAENDDNSVKVPEAPSGSFLNLIDSSKTADIPLNPSPDALQSRRLSFQHQESQGFEISSEPPVSQANSAKENSSGQTSTESNKPCSARFVCNKLDGGIMLGMNLEDTDGDIYVEMGKVKIIAKFVESIGIAHDTFFEPVHPTVDYTSHRKRSSSATMPPDCEPLAKKCKTSEEHIVSAQAGDFQQLYNPESNILIVPPSSELENAVDTTLNSDESDLAADHLKDPYNDLPSAFEPTEKPITSTSCTSSLPNQLDMQEEKLETLGSPKQTSSVRHVQSKKKKICENENSAVLPLIENSSVLKHHSNIFCSSTTEIQSEIRKSDSLQKVEVSPISPHTLAVNVVSMKTSIKTPQSELKITPVKKKKLLNKTNAINSDKNINLNGIKKDKNIEKNVKELTTVQELQPIFIDVCESKIKKINKPKSPKKSLLGVVPPVFEHMNNSSLEPKSPRPKCIVPSSSIEPRNTIIIQEKVQNEIAQGTVDNLPSPNAKVQEKTLLQKVKIKSVKVKKMKKMQRKKLANVNKEPEIPFKKPKQKRRMKKTNKNASDHSAHTTTQIERDKNFALFKEPTDNTLSGSSHGVALIPNETRVQMIPPDVFKSNPSTNLSIQDLSNSIHEKEVKQELLDMYETQDCKKSESKSEANTSTNMCIVKQNTNNVAVENPEVIDLCLLAGTSINKISSEVTDERVEHISSSKALKTNDSNSTDGCINDENLIEVNHHSKHQKTGESKILFQKHEKVPDSNSLSVSSTNTCQSEKNSIMAQETNSTLVNEATSEHTESFEPSQNLTSDQSEVIHCDNEKLHQLDEKSSDNYNAASNISKFSNSSQYPLKGLFGFSQKTDKAVEDNDTSKECLTSNDSNTAFNLHQFQETFSTAMNTEKISHNENKKLLNAPFDSPTKAKSEKYSGSKQPDSDKILNIHNFDLASPSEGNRFTNSSNSKFASNFKSIKENTKTVEVIEIKTNSKKRKLSDDSTKDSSDVCAKKLEPSHQTRYQTSLSRKGRRNQPNTIFMNEENCAQVDINTDLQSKQCEPSIPYIASIKMENAENKIMPEAEDDGNIETCDVSANGTQLTSAVIDQPDALDCDEEYSLVIDEDSGVNSEKRDVPAEENLLNAKSLEVCQPESSQVPRRNKKGKKRKKGLIKIKDPPKEPVLDSLSSAFLMVDKMQFSEQHLKYTTHVLVTALINPTTVPDVRKLLLKIVQYLSGSKRNPLFSYRESGDPSDLFPMAEECVVASLLEVEQKKKPHLHGLLEAAVRTLRVLVLTKPSLSIYALSSMCRVHAVLCRRTADSREPLSLCSDLLVRKHRFAPFLVAAVAGVWPQLFQVRDDADDVEKIFHGAIVYAVKSKPKALNEAQWKQCSTLILKFLLSKSITPKNDVNVLLSNIPDKISADNLPNYQLTSSLLILSTTEGWEWSKTTLIEKHILPSLESYSSESDGAAFEYYMNLFVDCCLFSDGDEFPREVLKYFIQKGSEDDKQVIKDCAVFSLIKLFMMTHSELDAEILEYATQYGSEGSHMMNEVEYITRMRYIGEHKEFTEDDIIV